MCRLRINPSNNEKRRASRGRRAVVWSFCRSIVALGCLAAYVRYREAVRLEDGETGGQQPARYTSNSISKSSRVSDFQASWPGMMASATPRFMSCSFRIFSSTVFSQISL